MSIGDASMLKSINEMRAGWPRAPPKPNDVNIWGVERIAPKRANCARMKTCAAKIVKRREHSMRGCSEIARGKENKESELRKDEDL